MKNETFTPERIKAEADAFFEWDGEDRSLVTTTSCLLFAQHIAGLMQARAAQPAPVVPEGYVLVPIKPTIEMVEVGYEEGIGKPDRSGHARVIEQYDAMLAAAPAQGQQVEWRTTAVMLEQANAGLAQLNGKLRAELSALKAQQVGQEPAGEVHLRKGGGISLLHVELAQPLPPGTKLYTAPQPAPAQDVAGLVEAAKKADDALSALVRNDRPLETLARKYGSDWSSAIDKVRTELVIQIAAHDKQSGEKKS